MHGHVIRTASMGSKPSKREVDCIHVEKHSIDISGWCCSPAVYAHEALASASPPPQPRLREPHEVLAPAPPPLPPDCVVPQPHTRRDLQIINSTLPSAMAKKKKTSLPLPPPLLFLCFLLPFVPLFPCSRVSPLSKPFFFTVKQACKKEQPKS